MPKCEIRNNEPNQKNRDLKIQLFGFLMTEYLNIDVYALCAILVYQLLPKNRQNRKPKYKWKIQQFKIYFFSFCCCGWKKTKKKGFS